MSLRTILSIGAFCAAAVSAAAVSQSVSPPSPITVETAPMFVAFGCDDNAKDEGVNWLVNYLKGKTNHDGSAARMSFFVNGSYEGDAFESWRAALGNGHEIGNHTYAHFPEQDGATSSKAIWAAEITKNAGVLTNDRVAMNPADIVGFRVPYLQYNPTETFAAIAEAGFLYDCSIEQGPTDSLYNGTQCWWPYTLDSGSLDNPDVAKTAGLWELPVHELVIPADSASRAYGLSYNLRDSLAIRMPIVLDSAGEQLMGFDSAKGTITGLDYNLMYIANRGDSAKIAQWYNGAEMDSLEYITMLKYNFDLRKKTNRAPFMFGIHSQFYIKAADGDYPSMTTLQRQGVIEDFIDYVLADSTVRFVPYRDIVQWMKNPVALDGTGAAAGPFTLTTRAVNGTVTVSPVKNTYAKGEVVTLSAVADSGYLFGYYTGDAWGTGASLEVTINGDMAVSGCFVGAPKLRTGCDTTLTVNMMKGSWTKETDATSTATVTKTDSSLVKIVYTMGQKVDTTWPYIDLPVAMPSGTLKNFSGLWKIRITYKSEQEFVMAMPTAATANEEVGYANWQVILPPAADWTTKEFSWDRFAQPAWKLMDVALVLSDVSGITFAPSVETAAGAVTDSFFVNQLTVIGLNPAGTDSPISPILSRNLALGAYPSILSVTRSALSFNLPRAGTYEIRLLGLNGRSIASAPAQSFAAGLNRLALNNVAPGMYVALIQGSGIRVTQKALIAR